MKKLILTLALAAFTAFAFSEELTGYEIAKRADGVEKAKSA